jgi:hypothetical protein
MSGVISATEAAKRKENLKMISDLMKSERVRGNPKDYVVLAGFRVIDWAGEFDVHADDGGTVGINGIALIHKKNLEPVLGEKFANQFWSKTLRRRRSPQ